MIQTIQIEGTNICQAECVFCPVSGMERKRGTMSMELFRKIIDDCKEIQPLEVMPFLSGEPFIDEHIFDRIAYINEALPNARVILYSNANALRAEKARRLSELRIHHINFSINAITDEARRELMGLPLTEAINNIFYYKDLDPTVSLSASMIFDPAYCSAIDAKAFEFYWGPRGVQPKLFPSGNWAGKQRPSYNTKTQCSRPKNSLNVLVDGRVPLCCFDLEGDVILGDLNNQTVRGVWESDLAKEYRDRNARCERKGLKLCENCTTI